nr:2-succinyl-5-enolpyruvyl-6-hydroxy-3-cyclohexene-1-carboxylic-acid synthase [Pantoea sp. 201603H]
MSISTFNHRWAEVIVEALTRHGIHHICIAPGSRSAPLTLAAAVNPKLSCHTHFDERGLGHLALGLAKSSQQPVAVIVTSGTAVANLYPAIIEAGLSGERLVLLTADRPAELIDCGANQAIEQTAIFAGHAATLNLPRPTADIAAPWLVAAIDNLLYQHEFGSMHINCPFAEPLYGDDNGEFISWRESLGDWWQCSQPWVRHSQRVSRSIQPDWNVWQQKRGVVIAGKLGTGQGRRVAEWAHKLGWPVLGDAFSQSGQPLPCADLWLANHDAQQTLAQAQIVIQFGTSLTGKRLLRWQEQIKPAMFWLIDRVPGRRDPAHHSGCRIVANINEWLDDHPAQPHAPWADRLYALSMHVKKAVHTATEAFGEAGLARRLPELLPKEGLLFLGNSLIVRLIDAFAQLPANCPVYGNRGASGIDGLLSTAAGVQRGIPRPMLIVLGDISMLYDLNALALLRQQPAPLILLVINNNGGQIFSLLPTPVETRERFFSMPQHISFEHAAALFGLQYSCPASWDALNQCVDRGWSQGGVTLIELNVVPEEGAQTLASLVQWAEKL